MAIKTFKRCEVVQYLQYCPDIGTADDVIKCAQKLTQLKSACAIIHDSDINEDGSPKPPHFHAVLTFSNSTTLDSIAKAFDVKPQYVNKINKSTKSAQLYLVHANDTTKHQYNPDEVSATFDYPALIAEVQEENRFSISDYVNRINNGEIREYNYTQFIGANDYVRHQKTIQSAFKYKYDSLNMEVNRHMETLFIYGESGCGKTTFAKKFATDKNYSIYISDGGANPLDGYKGQDCIILDDLRASDYKFNEFLKLTDPNTASQAHSRYYNKSLAWCKLLIITSTVPFKEWYRKLKEVDEEQTLQFERRFPNVIKMTIDDINFYYEGKPYGKPIANPCKIFSYTSKSSQAAAALQTIQSVTDSLADSLAQLVVDDDANNDLPF